MTLSDGFGLRLAVIVLAVLLALQLLTIGAGAAIRAREFGEPVQPALIAQAAAAVDLLESLPPERRDQAVRALSSPFLDMRLVGQFETSAPPDAEPLPAFRPVMAAYRAAMPDREIAVYRQRTGPIRSLLSNPRGRILLADETLVVIALNNGDALAISPSRTYRRHMAVAGLAMISSGLGVVLLIGLVWASLATSRPLRDMARAADAFAGDLDAPPMQEAGPAAVRELAKAFNRMQARLRSLVSERMTVLAGISHDLRTYLTRLRMRAEFIADEPQRDKTVRDLEDMTELLDDTLALAGALQGTQGRGMERIDLAGLVEEIVELRVEQGQPVFIDPTLSSRYSARVEVFGSRPWLNSAIGNLIDNAVRYGKAAHVGVRQGNGEVEVIVEDEGPGVPSAELEKLCDPFYRLETSRSRETGGSGLGLAIANAVAQSLGGRLELRNTGHGLEARLLFPVAQPETLRPDS